MAFNRRHNRSPSTRLLLALVLAFSCLAGYAHSANEKTTLNIAYYEHPPFSYTDEQGKARGLWIEKTGKIIEKAGFSWKAQAYPVKRIMQMMSSGKTDMFLGIKVQESRDKSIASKTILSKVELHLFYNSDHPIITNPEELKKGSVIVAISGYALDKWGVYANNPNNQITLSYIESHEAGLRRLKSRNADYLLVYKEPLEEIVKRTGAYPELRNNKILANTVHMNLSNRFPNAAAIMEKLDTANRALYGALAEDKVDSAYFYK